MSRREAMALINIMLSAAQETAAICDGSVHLSHPQDYTSAVNANGHIGSASTDASRSCSKCGQCPGLSLHYWR